MFYYHKGTQLNKCFTTTRHPTKQMFYYHKGTQLNKCFTFQLQGFYYQGYPTKQMFYYHKGTQLNY